MPKDEKASSATPVTEERAAAPEVRKEQVKATVTIRKRSAYAATTMTFNDGTPFTGLTAEVSPEEAERLCALGVCEKVE